MTLAAVLQQESHVSVKEEPPSLKMTRMNERTQAPSSHAEGNVRNNQLHQNGAPHVLCEQLAVSAFLTGKAALGFISAQGCRKVWGFPVYYYARAPSGAQLGLGFQGRSLSNGNVRRGVSLMVVED